MKITINSKALNSTNKWVVSHYGKCVLVYEYSIDESEIDNINLTEYLFHGVTRTICGIGPKFRPVDFMFGFFRDDCGISADLKLVISIYTNLPKNKWNQLLKNKLKDRDDEVINRGDKYILQLASQYRF